MHKLEAKAIKYNQSSIRYQNFTRAKYQYG